MKRVNEIFNHNHFSHNYQCSCLFADHMAGAIELSQLPDLYLF